MAYRTVLLHDGEVQTAKPEIKRLITTAPSPNAFAFHSKRKSSTLGSNETATGAIPCSGCCRVREGRATRLGAAATADGNRRYKFCRHSPVDGAHLCSDDDSLYREIPLEQIRAEFSSNFGTKIWEKWKMKQRRNFLKRMERPMRIELTPEPWQGSVLPLY